MEQQPLAGSQSGGLRKVARQCGQGCRFSPAGAGGGWRVEIWGLFFLCFDGFLAIFGMDSFIIKHQKHSKTICMWYTVCTNISNLICFGVGILRARQNFEAQQKPPKWIPTPKARAELEVLKRQRHEIKAQRKQAPKRVQSVHSHPVEGSNLFKTIVKTHGVPWDTCVG